MSGLAKAVKKVWRPIEKLKSKVMNVATLGLWEKTKKIRHKIVKSKAFKILAAAATIYFGGAGLMAMSNGGTFASGLSSAWSGATSAVSSIASGNFAQAGTALKTGFTGTTAAATTGANVATSADVLASLGGNTGTVATTGSQVAGAADITAALGASAPAVVPAAAPAAAAAAPAGLFGLGELGTSALITAGTQAVGSVVAGAGQDKAEKEARDRMTFAGVNGQGVGTGLGTDGLFNPVSMNNIKPSTAQWTPNNMDDIVRMYSTTKRG